ncbi:hypothetical protein, partial [Enterobacter hormaechei]|uniref:hypothetical protein n=1 Tax=Enterobacter hormaechei TaxID=158836 RepID=UPI00123B0584
TDTGNVRTTAPEVNNPSSYTLRVVVTDGKTSVQSNVQVTVNPKPADVTPPADEVTPPADDVTPPADDVTPPADDVTPPSDEGS